MAAPHFADIYLLISPLKFSRTNLLSTPLQERVFKYLAPLGPEWFHWTIMVRGTCYEVASTGKGHDVKMISYEDWRCRRDLTHHLRIKTKIGITRISDRNIRNEADHIWNKLLRRRYRVLAQNCQNFAYALYKRIRVDPESVTAKVSGTFQPFPHRLSFVKDVALFMVSVGA